MAQSWIEQRWLDEYMAGREEQLERLAAASSISQREVDAYMDKLKRDMDQAGLSKEDQVIIERGASIMKALGMDLADLMDAAKQLGSVQCGMAAAQLAAAAAPSPAIKIPEIEINIMPVGSLSGRITPEEIVPADLMRGGCKHETLSRYDETTYICSVCGKKAAAAVIRS